MRKYGNYTSEGYGKKAYFAWQTSSSSELPYDLVSKTKELSEHYCKFTFPSSIYKYLKVAFLSAKDYHPFTGSKIISNQPLSKSEGRQQFALM